MEKVERKDTGKRNLIGPANAPSDMNNPHNLQQSKGFRAKWNGYRKIKKRKILKIIF